MHVFYKSEQAVVYLLQADRGYRLAYRLAWCQVIPSARGMPTISEPRDTGVWERGTTKTDDQSHAHATTAPADADIQ